MMHRRTGSTLEGIESALGTPAHRGDKYLIYQGDCAELMKALPPDFGALTITSPPYNIGKEYEQPRPVAEYLDWCESWIRLVHRFTRRDGAFWLNLGYIPLDGRAKAMPISYLLWQRVPFYLVQEIVWNYGAGVAAKRSFSPRNEKFSWYVKNPDDYVFNLDAVRDPNVKYPNQKKNGKKKCNPLGKNPSDVWQFPKVTFGQRSEFQGADGPPRPIPDRCNRPHYQGLQQAGRLDFRPVLGIGVAHRSRAEK